MDGLTKLANEIGHARDYGQMASAAARKLLDIVAELNAQRMAALSQQADEIWAEVAERYVELPRDADGEYIHVGDIIEGSRGKRHSVDTLELHKRGGWTAGEYGTATHVNQLSDWRIVKEPTTESLLREFYRLAVRGRMADPDEIDDAVLAEYAAKLRLAGDAE